MSGICFDSRLCTIDEWTILRLPEIPSRKLRPRRRHCGERSISLKFQTVLEQEGYSATGMTVDGKLQQIAGIGVGDTATLETESIERWSEPHPPEDFETALADCPSEDPRPGEGDHADGAVGMGSLGNARKNPDTRKRRVEVGISKMNSRKRLLALQRVCPSSK